MANRKELKEIIKSHIKNNKLNAHFNRPNFIKKHKLENFEKDLIMVTSFLDENTDKKIRMFCVLNDIFEYPKCQYCHKIVKKFWKNLCDGWFAKFCSRKCSCLVNNPHDFMTEQTKQIRSQKLSKALSGRKMNEEWKSKLKSAANDPEVTKKKEKTNLKRYGVSNPGVLGARASKSGRRYIKKFLKDNNINESCTYFDGGGITNKEFYVIINGKPASYDLVVFESSFAANNRDFTKIKLILEYHGPWHYKKYDVIERGSELSSPYQNSVTIKESFEWDKRKREYINRYAKFYVYWSKTKELEIYEPTGY